MLSADSIVEEVPSSGGDPTAKRKASNVEIITLESSSEEEDDDDDEDDDEETQPPPAKRPYDPALASAGPTVVSDHTTNGDSHTPTPLDNNTPVIDTESNSTTDVASISPSVATPVISASVASSLAQLPAGTSVLATTGDAPPPVVQAPPIAAQAPPNGAQAPPITSQSTPPIAAQAQPSAAAVVAAAASSPSAAAAAVATITPVSHSPNGSGAPPYYSYYTS